MGATVVVSTRVLRWMLAAIVTALALASLASQLGKPVLLDLGLWKVQQLFDADGELNVTTWYAASSLLACAVLLALIAHAKFRAADAYARHWAALAIVFVGLSIDEAVSVHESTIRPLRALLGTGGIFYYAWVVPAIVGVAALGLLYARFLRDLPPASRRLFVLAGAVFCAGAIGMEMVEGLLVEVHGKDSLARLLPTTIEETLEMAGVAIFLYALVSYIAGAMGTITVYFRALPQEASAPRPAREPVFAAPAVSRDLEPDGGDNARRTDIMGNPRGVPQPPPWRLEADPGHPGRPSGSRVLHRRA